MSSPTLTTAHVFRIAVFVEVFVFLASIAATHEEAFSYSARCEVDEYAITSSFKRMPNFARHANRSTVCMRVPCVLTFH